MNRCRLCHDSTLDTLRDFGRQPVCNRFLAGRDDAETLFPLILGQCSRCSLVQVTQSVPPDELRSRYPWITYTEPSAHLDRLAQTVSALPGVSHASVICGIFLPNDPTLTRFQAAGFKHGWRLDLHIDLGVADPCAGTETLQSRMDAAAADAIVARRGRADLVIARHILEHSHDLTGLMQGVRRLVKPDGHVIFEVPDCQPALERNDYTTLWEEHVSYFTMATLEYCLESNGWQIIHREQAGPSLVAIVKPAEMKPLPPPAAKVVKTELSRGKSFASAFPGSREKIKGFLTDYARQRGKIAVFGAGHLSCVFINLLEIQDQLFCVIDDHEKKQGMFMPGSRLPILPARALAEESAALCLSSLGRATDARLAAKNPGVRDFLAKGGELCSLLPGETYFLEAASRPQGRL